MWRRRVLPALAALAAAAAASAAVVRRAGTCVGAPLRRGFLLGTL
jgi:hypothetical protein